MSINKKYFWFIFLGLIITATTSSLVAMFVFNFLMSPSKEVELNKKYPLLSKRIFIENQNDILINFVPLRLALREYVSKNTNKLGVYFEYLPSGISIGVNDRTEVRLASLSKVPLAMAILKKVEEERIDLYDEVTLINQDIDQAFGDLWQRGAGTKLTVKDLVEISLQHSDNTAYRALFRLLTPVEVNAVYENLEIQVSFDEGYPFVSPKSYSSIFRSLYLSSFLSEENSHYLLSVLSDTSFDDSITNPIPTHVPVSHKVGVFSELSTGENIFIDCGIIYEPLRPYMLCLFVKGDQNEAKRHMIAISDMIYQYVHKVRGSSEN
ncbi:MAG: hypothetical protein RI935_2 [Candidatus Parcubacteria bacterium]|jgi:beta-lactamase class A